MFNYWTTTSHLANIVPSYSKIPSSSDVVIVGGGIVGLAVAYALSVGTEHSVTLLEKNMPGVGTTSNMHGLIDLKFTRKIGKHPQSKYIANLSRNGLGFIRTIIEKHSISCEPNFCGGFHVASSTSELSHLKKLATITGSSIKDPSDVKEVTGLVIPNYGGIFIPEEFTLHPFKLCQALTQILTHSGQYIVPFANVVDVNKTSKMIMVMLENGHQIRTKNVVYCTNDIPPWIDLPLSLEKRAFYSFISSEIEEPLTILPASCQYNNHCVHEFTNRIIVTQQGKVLLSPFSVHIAAAKNILKRAKSKIRKQIPLKANQLHVNYCYEFDDELPIIGKIPGRPGEYLCIGFGRSGMSLAFPCATIVINLINHDDVNVRDKIFSTERGLTNAETG